MTKGELAQIYADYLRKEGYLPQVDEDSDVIFKAEGKGYLIICDDGDDAFIRIAFPNFWSLDSEDEKARALKAAYEATVATKVAKVFVVGSNMWAVIELFVSPPEVPGNGSEASLAVPAEFQQLFQRSLGALMYAVRVFVEKMRQ